MNRLSRREALVGLTAAGAGAALLSGCGVIGKRFIADRDFGTPTMVPDADWQWLSRTTFGPVPKELEKLQQIGHAAYLDDQLLANKELPLPLIALLRRSDALVLDSMEAMDIPKERLIEGLQAAAILRATYNPNQLFERVVDFWSNHFNVYSRKADGAFYKGNQEDRVIRKHALGNFKDLLTGMTFNPAMLEYLDNDKNTKGHPNENLARELLELHSMGVRSSYTQQDIQELARCLTGWGIQKRFVSLNRGRVHFFAEKHDDGPKKLLGIEIPPNGKEKDMFLVLDHLSTHPETATYIARKMCRFFAGGEDERTVTAAANAFLDSKGDIRATLRAVLLSPVVGEGEPMIRRPFEYLCASLRVTNAETDANPNLQRWLRKMGQPMYEWPMPDGYPMRTASWSGAMLQRWNFAHALATNDIPGTSINAKDLPELRTRSRAISTMSNHPEQIALALCSPEFQWM